jgi:hypothetical protein
VFDQQGSVHIGHPSYVILDIEIKYVNILQEFFVSSVVTLTVLDGSTYDGVY